MALTPNYAAIAASDGSGEAVKATVQSARTIGSTSITVDATTNWPTGTFIATTGTLNSTGQLISTTAQVFYGTASGTTITITSFAPGYTDQGNAIGDVVVLKPTTEWANQVQAVISNMYPVGCIYTETTGTNPATTFGFGTWAAFGGGRVMVGAGTSDQTFTAGATGGESNHTLTNAESPSHNHGVNDPGHVHDGNGAEFILNESGGAVGYSSGPNGLAGITSTTSSTTGITTQNTGGGGAHNNLQPYIVVYFWKRTA